MAETPVPITTGNGSASIAGDLVSGNIYQQIKLVDGTIGGNTPLKVNADGSITASIYGNITTSSTPNQSVSGTIGASIIGAAPVTIVSQSAGSGTLDGVTGANTTLTTTPYNYVFNGTNWDRQRGNSSVGTLVAPFAFPNSFISGVTSVITGTSSVQVLTPAPAGQRNYITNLLVTNAAAVGTTVQLFDGGNVIYAGFAAASGGGFALAFPTGLRQSSIAGNLSALATVQASIFVSANGYTAA